MTENSTNPNRWGRIPAWWLDHPDLDADGLAVLAALSTYADEAGVCWPSQATLADKLKRSRPTVNRILGRLEALGLVGIEHRRSANGGRLSCRYRLALIAANAPEEKATDGAGVDSPADSAADSPCSAASHEQPEPEQIPDTLHRRADEGKASVAGAVPQDWTPPTTDREWAVSRFPDLDVDGHAERFVQQCRAHGYRYRDPAAAWRSWLLQDAGRMAPQPAATVRGSANRGARTASRTTPPTAAANAEQRLSAWASVAARLNAGQSATPANPWGIA
ncbi:helix-turn-helix domain-containing protein [Azospirillum sp. TSA2s]|uniref:helix-turn-helix domain-containing protein n=1 Tax=Azospirillum sp. TSA2s TaxID=709810 RepID=UPI0010AA288A|nr:helix-turn-helix domain-containing protein [Azospirillum sp. TSA2s]QCG95199.1 helix-turn-helix domain-containing protein [Azospirillum sp. TSA2s]